MSLRLIHPDATGIDAYTIIHTIRMGHEQGATEGISCSHATTTLWQDVYGDVPKTQKSSSQAQRILVPIPCSGTSLM